MPFVVGLNHETAPVQLREKLAIPAARLSDMRQRLRAQAALDEVVWLSTCNRIEIYARAARRGEAREALIRQLQAHAQVQGLHSHLYFHEGEGAVHHLFRVAAGLDSMVKGENEILGQVKQSYLSAHQGGFTGKFLNVLFQRSLYVGKRVRTETGLAAGSSSVGSVAVAMAERIFGNLKDRRVMILGAGQMAELTAKYLLSQKIQSLFVSNRTFERAQELAARFGGQALNFEEGLRRMEFVDIVICSTAAPHPVIRPDSVAGIMQRRKGLSLFFIDIAVPRDVDPAVHGIDNVYVYDIDDLRGIVADNQVKRSQEIPVAEKIVEEEAREFARWLQARLSGLPHGLRVHPAPSSALALHTLPPKVGEGKS